MMTFHKNRDAIWEESLRLGAPPITGIRGSESKDGLVHTLPSSGMITYELGSTLMTLRGSGTEPKLKWYIEAKAETMAEAESKAEKVQDGIKLFFRGYGLQV